MKEPNASAAIAEIFEKYATGNYSMPSLIDIYNRATNEKRGWKVLEDTLANPFYYGAMRVKGKLMRGQHEPTISKQLFDACQKMRGLRKSKFQRGEQQITKPFMALMKCGVCGHAVTGEAKPRPSGKIYIYYHCANRLCDQKRIVTEQAKIHEQIVQAFKPFEPFTEKATDSFIRLMQEQFDQLDLYTRQETELLQQKRLELKQECRTLLEMKSTGKLSDKAYQEFLKIKQEALEELDLEICGHSKADTATFNEGLRIIELFTKISRFMELGQDLLGKSQMAKLVLSNVLLKDGKLCYDYVSPFDDLLKFAGSRVWWRKRDLHPQIFLQFSPQVIKLFPEILVDCS